MKAGLLNEPTLLGRQAVTATVASMRVQISSLAAAIMLGGCSAGSNSPVADDPPVWGRSDCQRGQGNPELQQQFEDAKAACSARGESAYALAGKTGGSRCMTEQGYVLRTRAEHGVACQAVRQTGTAVTQSKGAQSLEKSVPQQPAGPAKK